MSAADQQESLTSRSLTAVIWGGGGAFIRISLQLGAQVALARILGPEQFGLFAIGAVVISFSSFFSDIGLAYGLIQKPKVRNNDVRYVFTWQLIIGALAASIIAGSSQRIALFFGNAGAHDLVFYLSAICLLNALTATSTNLLKRSMDFKTIQIAQLSGYICGYILIGLPLAMLGAKVWALVFAWLAQCTVVLIIQYSVTKHSILPLLWYKDARSVSGFGLTVFFTNIVNWTIGNIDRVIVARLFPATEVGIYATVYNLLLNPTSSLLGIVQPVFYSASSKMGAENEKVAKGYLTLINGVALFVLPLFLTVAAVAPTFIFAIYGPSWQASSYVFRPLALAMPIFLLWGLTTPLLWARGHPAREFKIQFPIALFWALASWGAAKHSITAVSWSVTGMYALRFLLIFRVASQSLSITWHSLWRSLRGGMFLGIICATLAVLIDELLPLVLPLPALIMLLIEITICASVFLLILKYVRGLMSNDLALIVNGVAAKCPKFIRRILQNFSDLRRVHVSH